MSEMCAISKDHKEIFSEITNSIKKNLDTNKLSHVIDIAFSNFEREMKQPLEEMLEIDCMKDHIYDILLKHYILSMINSKLFENEEIKIISRKIRLKLL